jgi:hypothetical protein
LHKIVNSPQLLPGQLTPADAALVRQHKDTIALAIHLGDGFAYVSQQSECTPV